MSRRDCESTRPLVSAFFDGDITPSESVALHRHLASCESCRRLFDEYQRIRSDFGELPPTPPPPPELARAVWSETVDRPPVSRVRRLFGGTSARIGLSTAAALAFLILISAFLLIHSYNQGLNPSVSSSVPVSDQNWPIYQPVRIEFNKPMDHASVEANLQIFPPGERTRIPLSWDDNTLVLGSSTSESALLLPDTTYQVVVLGTARDSYGHALGNTFSLSFRTSSTTDTASKSTPTAEATPSASPTQVTTGDSAVAQQSSVAAPPLVPTATPNPTAQSSGVPATITGGVATTASGDNPKSTPTTTESTVTPPAVVATTPVATQMPVTPTVPAQTPVSTPEATATQAVVQPTATPAPTASPTPSATPVETETPASGTPTAVVIGVTGAFGSVYWANGDVQAKLGAATVPAVQVNAAELGFQRGTMYERYDTSEIYVLFISDNQWIEDPDTWTASDGPGGGQAPGESDLWIPKDGFGIVWNSDPSLASSIGYAVDPDAHVMGGVLQQFTHGIMLYSDQGFVYVLYDDGTWQLFPDTSGHGDLINTPTPAPTEPAGGTSTPASTPATDSTDVQPTATP